MPGKQSSHCQVEEQINTTEASRGARLFSCPRASFPSTQRTPVDCLQKITVITCLFCCHQSLQGHLASYGGSPEGSAAEVTWWGAGRKAWATSWRVFSLPAEQASFSLHLKGGYPLMNLNLSTSVGSNNSLGACRDGNPSSCTGDTSLLCKMDLSLIRT